MAEFGVGLPLMRFPDFRRLFPDPQLVNARKCIRGGLRSSSGPARPGPAREKKRPYLHDFYFPCAF